MIGRGSIVATVIVLLGIAVAALLYLSKDAAAQFFGAFLAAIVAAGAVIGNAYYQAELTRQRDDRIAFGQYRSDVVRLIGFFRYAAGKARAVEQMFEAAIASAREREPEKEQAPVLIRAGDVREIGAFELKGNWEQLLRFASALPHDLAEEIVNVIYQTMNVFDHPIGRDSAGDLYLDEPIIATITSNFSALSALIQNALDKLASHIAGPRPPGAA